MDMSEARRSESSESLELLRVGAWIVAFGAIAFVLEAFLGNYNAAAPLLGLFVIDYLARRFGFYWDHVEGRTVLRQCGIVALGFLLGAGVVLLLVGAALAFGWAVVSIGRPTLGAVLPGLLVPFATAARDELLFRGAPLALLRERVSDRIALPFVALLGAAPMALQSKASVIGIAVAVLSGWVFAMAVRASRGLFLAWGAHAGWLFMLGAGTNGMVLDVEVGSGMWSPLSFACGNAGLLLLGVSGIAAIVVTAVYWSRGACLIGCGRSTSSQ